MFQVYSGWLDQRVTADITGCPNLLKNNYYKTNPTKWETSCFKTLEEAIQYSKDFIWPLDRELTLGKNYYYDQDQYIEIVEQ